MIAQERIKAYKMGGETLIDLNSIDEYHVSLRTAVFSFLAREYATAIGRPSRISAFGVDLAKRSTAVPRSRLARRHFKSEPGFDSGREEFGDSSGMGRPSVPGSRRSIFAN